MCSLYNTYSTCSSLVEGNLSETPGTQLIWNTLYSGKLDLYLSSLCRSKLVSVFVQGQGLKEEALRGMGRT